MMRILTAAIFLALLFYTVSGNSEDPAPGFNQNPEYSIPAPEPAQPADKSAKQPETTDAESFGDEPDKKNRPSDKNQTGYGSKVPGKSRPQNQPYSGSLWEDELKEWEKRNSPVPQRLPSATFPLRRQTFTESKWERTFRSSSPRIRHSKRINRIKSTCRTCRSCD